MGVNTLFVSMAGDRTRISFLDDRGDVDMEWDGTSKRSQREERRSGYNMLQLARAVIGYALHPPNPALTCIIVRDQATMVVTNARQPCCVP